MSCEFRIFRHFVTIFRNLMIFKMSYLFNQVRVSKNIFSHSSSSLSTLSKLLTCYGISWNLYFAVNLMTSFLARHKPLKSKIQKHTIVGNTKFYYLAKSQLKRLKIEKVDWKCLLFDDSWPGVKTGLFYVLLTSKGGNIAFPPPSPPCNVVPMFELPIDNDKHLNFEWRGQRRGADSFVFLSYPILVRCFNNFAADCSSRSMNPRVYWQCKMSLEHVPGARLAYWFSLGE